MAHGASVNCLALGHKSGRVLVTGGDDKKVNLWAVGKPNCIMVSLIYFLLSNKKGHREREKVILVMINLLDNGNIWLPSFQSSL